MRRLTWFPFFAHEYLADYRLRRCSLAAHGLLLNVQALANDHDGRLVLPGILSREATTRELAQATGGKAEAEVSAALDELLDAGALEWDGHVLTVPRMIEDREYRAKARAYGLDGYERKKQKLKLTKGAATLKGARKGALQLQYRQYKTREYRVRAHARRTARALQRA
jgi:hypothetical protein